MTKIYGKAGLGCWAFGSGYWSNQPVSDSKNTIAKALDLGITHFDTAQAYGNGTSEQIVGQALRKDRGNVTIASKSFIPDSNNMEGQVEKSLKRLNINFIDLYYLHWPRKEGYDLRPAMESLERCRSRGLIGAIGVSNFSTDQMKSVMQVGTIDAHQLCYSPLWIREGNALFDFCASHNIATLGYSILAQGIMCGKFTNPPTDVRKNLAYASGESWPVVTELLEQWRLVANELKVSLTTLTVAWAGQRLDTPLLGARNPEQLTDQWKGIVLDIPKAFMKRLDKSTEKADKLIAQGSTNQFNHQVQ